MLTPETLRRIRLIELRTRKLVNNSFAGAYQSVFKGRGTSFDDLRVYEPGDDIRDIAWKVTARAGEPYVKRYIEERELTVLLVVDSSASNFFGTGDQNKREIAAEIGAVLAYSAIANNDKVGLLIFSDEVEHYKAPNKGRNHVLTIINDLLSIKPSQRGTSLTLAIQTARQVLKRKTVIFLMSDFLTEEDYSKDLLALNRKHEVISVVLRDTREREWPQVGVVALRDAETDNIQWIDTNSLAWQKQFRKRTSQFRAKQDKLLAYAGVGRIDIASDEDYVTALLQYFQRNARY